MSRNPRRAIAQQTVEILDQGSYRAPSGHVVELAARVAAAVAGTVLYRPDELDELVRVPSAAPGLPTRIEVTGETTLAAAHRLTGGDAPPLALNFASAKNPGGGFLRGAHAQEEGLARSSALYASLRAAPDYYAFHRVQGDLLYSDHMIYSPSVPVFRDDDGTLLDAPYDVAFVTSPAPNRGAIREKEHAARVPAALAARAAKVLAVAAAHGHARLVLGAWGCGVFGNDPAEVAAVFATLLRPGGAYAGRFEHIVFAVWDTAPGAPRHAAFERAFGAA
ncbi:TIGR02452: family protein [Actinomadura rubteroloni]|uniref:TIGR02452: family protein n=1 Tax=Actinomadura rubteroloni TaxID=1926885 RepID=A0A2P4UCW3_9ACTN|nr:TIGR02452 family protein [Actinomadura rubteroloni]POM22889.1 TIGR02452: family protein [Actinomadura rubteroloni]